MGSPSWGVFLERVGVFFFFFGAISHQPWDGERIDPNGPACPSAGPRKKKNRKTKTERQKEMEKHTQEAGGEQNKTIITSFLSRSPTPPPLGKLNEVYKDAHAHSNRKDSVSKKKKQQNNKHGVQSERRNDSSSSVGRIPAEKKRLWTQLPKSQRDSNDVSTHCTQTKGASSLTAPTPFSSTIDWMRPVNVNFRLRLERAAPPGLCFSSAGKLRDESSQWR